MKFVGFTVPDRQQPCVRIQSNPATFRTLDGLRLAATLVTPDA
jgi:hypothetical protein